MCCVRAHTRLARVYVCVCVCVHACMSFVCVAAGEVGGLVGRHGRHGNAIQCACVRAWGVGRLCLFCWLEGWSGFDHDGIASDSEAMAPWFGAPL